MSPWQPQMGTSLKKKKDHKFGDFIGSPRILAGGGVGSLGNAEQGGGWVSGRRKIPSEERM